MFPTPSSRLGFGVLGLTKKKDRIGPAMFLSVVLGPQKLATEIVRRGLHGPFRTDNGISYCNTAISHYTGRVLQVGCGGLRHPRFIHFFLFFFSKDAKGKLHFFGTLDAVSCGRAEPSFCLLP
jgi:hypothetical protein